MHAAIIQFPGTNRENDLSDALRQAGFNKISIIWHKETFLPSNLDAIYLPGGFAYGDYLRTGAMAAHSVIMREVKAAAQREIPIMGICNGFQILCEAKLLPGMLTRNKDMQFICDWQKVKIMNNDNIFLKKYQKNQECFFPIAHGEGNYQCDLDTLKKLQDKNMIALKYANNPNGSLNDIAGITSENGRVFGLMPHPENAAMPWQKYQDGANIFAF